MPGEEDGVGCVSEGSSGNEECWLYSAKRPWWGGVCGMENIRVVMPGVALGVELGVALGVVRENDAGLRPIASRSASSSRPVRRVLRREEGFEEEGGEGEDEKEWEKEEEDDLGGDNGKDDARLENDVKIDIDDEG